VAATPKPAERAPFASGSWPPVASGLCAPVKADAMDIDQPERGGKAKKPTQKATAMRRPAFRVHPSDSFDELNSDSDNETTDAPPTIKKRKANASSVEDVPDSPPVKVVRQDDVVHVSNNSYV
jgi:hypothetical protein